MNYLGGNKFEEETLKKEICSQLSVFSQVDLKDAAEKLLSDIAGEYDTESIALNEVSVEAMMKAWSELFVNIIADNIKRN